MLFLYIELSLYRAFSTYIEFSANNVERWHQIVAVASKSKMLSAYLDSKLMGTKSSKFH